MSAVEQIDPEKIFHINLGYDFNLYPKLNPDNVEAIKQKYSADILLITVGRLDRFKRPSIALEILERLVLHHSVNAKLIFLGNGELEEELQAQVKQKGLANAVFFLGYVENVLEYMAAATFLVHPSISESSSVAVKEAALVNLPIIACKNVGDFDQYLLPELNSFLVTKENMTEESISIILHNYRNEAKLRQLTTRMKEQIIKNFSIQQVIPHYSKFLRQN
jgi:glycosyltransferase involved in cell wall biosynthesis